MVMLTCPSRHT